MPCFYICRSCRTRLLRGAPRLRNSQWHSKATFISLTNPKTPQSDDPTPPASEFNPQSSSQAPQLSTTEAKRSRNADTHSYDDLLSMLPKQTGAPIGRYSRHSQKELDSASLTQTGPEEVSSEHNASAEPRIIRVESSTPRAAYIMRELDLGRTNTAWATFLEHFGTKDSPALVNPSLRDLGALNRGRVFQRLLSALAVQWCNDASTPSPPPTEVVLRYEEVGIMRPEFWTETIWLLTYQTLWRTAAENPNFGEQERTLSELMALWRLLFECKRVHSAQPKITPSWTPLAYNEPGEGFNALHQTRKLENRLQKFMPKFVPTTTIALSALLAFNFFTQNDESNSDFQTLRSENKPFVKLVANLLPGANLQPLLEEAKASKDIGTFSPVFLEELLNQLRSTPSKALVMIGAKNYTRINPLAHQDPENAKDLQEFFLKRLTRAFERQDERMVESLWEEARAAYSNGPSGTAAIPPRIYEAFLTGFMATRRSDRAIDTWNYMVASGNKPTVKTWTAMIVGCEKSRDLEALNQMWTRMLKSGIQPDVYAWTSRIHGLLVLRQISDGFAALDEMGRLWREAQAAATAAAKTAKSKRKGAISSSSTEVQVSAAKPSIETINSVVTAIGRLPNSSWDKKRELIGKVLQWAGSYAIKPNVTTYNSLIRIALKDDTTSEVFKLLRQMKAENVEPDIATFTMILSSTFQTASYAQMDEDRQSQMVIALLRDLEARGLKFNEFTYSTAINSLLKQHNNYGATRAVLNHMSEKGLRAGPHIYTSLITHYFQQDPPAIRSIDSLWTQITSTPGTSTDAILFDRLIEGYASVGEVGKMMAVLAKMSTHGKTPGWNALTATLRALVDAGDMVRARSIVKDVRHGEGLARYGVSSRYRGAFGMMEFWEMARKSGFQDIVDEVGTETSSEFGTNYGEKSIEEKSTGATV